VEDCEDLEVTGVDSETNVVGITWPEKAGTVNGESFTEIERLQQTAGPCERRESCDASESEVSDNIAGGNGLAIKPTSSMSNQTFSRVAGLKENASRIESPGNSDDGNDDDDNNNDYNGTQSVLDQTSSHVEELREIPGQYGRPKDHANVVNDESDFDDDDDDDGDGDGDDDVVEPTNMMLKQDAAQDNKPVTAALTTAIAAKSEKSTNPHNQFSGGRNASDEGTDDGDNYVDNDNTYVKNGAVIPFTGASDSFDEVFAKNVDSDPQMMMQNGNREDIGTDSNNGQRSRLSRQHCEVEDLEETGTVDCKTVSSEHDAMRVLQSLQENNDGSESEEDIETFGDKAVDDVESKFNRFKSPGDSQPTYNKAEGSKTEQEVRILTIMSSVVVSVTYDRTMLEPSCVIITCLKDKIVTDR